MAKLSKSKKKKEAAVPAEKKSSQNVFQNKKANKKSVSMSSRDKKLLITLFSLLLFAGTYFFSFTVNLEETEAIEQENETLRNRITELTQRAAQADALKEETALIKEGIAKRLEEFPPDLKTEDVIAFLNQMEEEKKNELKISTETFGVKENFYSVSVAAAVETPAAEGEEVAMRGDGSVYYAAPRYAAKKKSEKAKKKAKKARKKAKEQRKAAADPEAAAADEATGAAEADPTEEAEAAAADGETGPAEAEAVGEAGVAADGATGAAEAEAAGEAGAADGATDAAEAGAAGEAGAADGATDAAEAEAAGEAGAADGETDAAAGEAGAAADAGAGDVLAELDAAEQEMLAEGEEEAGGLNTDGPYTGYRISSQIAFQTTYSGLKHMIDMVNGHKDKVRIQTLSASFDNTTGAISGSMSLCFYAVDGSGKAYEAPEVKGVPLGLRNIFGTVSKSAE